MKKYIALFCFCLAAGAWAIDVRPNPSGQPANVNGANISPANVAASGTLDVIGATTVTTETVNGRLLLKDGAENDGAMCWANDTDTCFYSTTNGYTNITSDGQDNARFGAGTSIFYNSSGVAFVSFNGSSDNTIIPAGSGRFEYGDGTVTTGQRYNIEGQAADPFTLSISSPNGTRVAYIDQEGDINVGSATVRSDSFSVGGSTFAIAQSSISLGVSIAEGIQLFYCAGGTFAGNLCRGTACICTGGTATGLNIYVK